MTAVVVGLFAVVLAGTWLFARWGASFGSTAEERAGPMPGDEFFDGAPRPRKVMTRAVSIDAPPERVWPWVAQTGRGAGFFSFDSVDNGLKTSARHLVSWIPEPRPGDASAIGYLRHLDVGRSLAWWLGGTSFLGTTARVTLAYRIEPEGEGTRLVSRIAADATGPLARLGLLLFVLGDSVMACRQLVVLRERAERGELRADAETGSRRQYQLIEVAYAAGGRAGVVGGGAADRQREAAIRDGVLREEPG